MVDGKDLTGLLSVLLSLTAFGLYLRDALGGKTKPHAFSWLIWAVLAGIGFAASVVGNGGAGSWVLGVDAAVCTLVFLLALSKGETDYVLFDWIALALAFLALFLWWMTETPVFSVLLITLADVFAFVPTFRKSFRKPFEESLSMYVLSSLKFIAAFGALQTYSIVTGFYPGSLIVIDGGFVLMLLVRRRQARSL